MIRKNQYTKPVVVFDMDGVVADFTFSQTRLLKQLFGKPEYPLNTFAAKSWGLEWLGLTKENEITFWQSVQENDQSFWREEREIIPRIVRRIADIHDHYVIYFCTTRDDLKSGSAREQSIKFLSDNDYYGAQVVVSDRKGDFCYAVQATYFIDDKFDNCRQVREKSPETFVYFLSLPHSSANDVEQARIMGMTVVTSVEDFLKMLEHKLENLECCNTEYYKNAGKDAVSD